ncbi:MAG: MFS transporter [Candidatus Lokiarchaeota archaeon]|nr:MFS transporter [Candidatus Lokiarchaeota archaeon]
MTKWKEKHEYDNSRLIMASFGSHQFFSQWITGAFGLFVLYFYEVEIGLPTVLVSLAFVLYSIWNAINDPLMGYLVEHLYMPWQKKWGFKRFPWIVIFAIPWLFTYLMIFLVPTQWYGTKAIIEQHQWLIFFWFMISIMLYDTFFTIWNVNAVGLYPDKFVKPDERRTATAIGTIIGMIGIVVGMLVPPLLVNQGIAQTYRNMAWICVGIGIILFLFILPGVWENEDLRERYEKQKEIKERLDREPFFKAMLRVIRDRRFIAKVLFFFGYQASAALIQASAPYIITFLLNMENWALTVLLGAMLLGAMISIFFWLRLSKKVNNNKKMSLYGGWAMFIGFIPIILIPITGFIGGIIALLIWGVGLGGQWFMDPPTMGDTLDDLAVRNKKRENSIYYGWNAFFIRLSGVFTAVVFAFVHTLTGFVEGAQSLAELQAQSPTPALARFGIIIHAAIVPAILVLITIYIFWKYYDITPELVEENQKKIEELGI